MHAAARDGKGRLLTSQWADFFGSPNDSQPGLSRRFQFGCFRRVFTVYKKEGAYQQQKLFQSVVDWFSLRVFYNLGRLAGFAFG